MISVRACARGLNLVVLLWCVSELIDLSSLGERASPFIDEGDGFTRESERKRECVLPSLVAHTVGYKTVYRRPQYC